jgi:hypothetical protein
VTLPPVFKVRGSLILLLEFYLYLFFFRLLYQSLGVLNEHFTTHSQEDAVEFLTEFFSALREEFTRLCNNEVCTTPAGNCQQKHNIITNDMNSCQQDQSDTYIEQKNPVDENIIFKLKENHSCVM